MHLKRSIGLASAVALAACSPAATGTSAPAPSGATEKRAANQVIKVAQLGMPGSMSPEASNSYVPIYWSMFDVLVALDPKLVPQPQIAEKWSQPNPTTWRFTIRKGATFSNGDPVTAADVESTGKLMLETRTPQIVQFPNLTEVKLVNETDVDFITKTQDASILGALPYLWIMPKKYYESVGKNGYALKPIGSGPYEMQEFRSADFVRLTKRTGEHPFRKAQATELTFRSFTEQNAMVAGFRTGDLDILVGSLLPDNVDNLARTADAKVENRLVSSVSLLYSQPENKTRNTPLTDKRVREALNYAIDKQAISDKLYKGFAKPSGQLTVPISPGWDDNVKPYPYDPAIAKRMLAEAGYPNGFKLPIGLEYTALTGSQDLMVTLQGYLKDVGVEVAVTQYELALFLDKFYGRAGQTKGDLFYTAVGDPNGFATTLVGYYTCDKPLHWWCNPAFDSNFNQALGEPDVVKRGALMKKAIAAIREDVGVLYLLSTPTFLIQQKKISGFVWTTDVFFNMDSAYRVE